MLNANIFSQWALFVIYVIISVKTRNHWPIISTNIIDLKNKSLEIYIIYLFNCFFIKITALENLKEQIQSFVERTVDGRWRCNSCNYTSRLKHHVTQHIECKHIQTSGFVCHLCDQFCKDRKSLANHHYKHHKQ